MILAFLQAELQSPRFQSYYPMVQGYDRERLVFVEPRLDDPVENDLRKQLLAAVRGFGASTLLFPGFPTEVRWLRVAYTVEEVGAMKYANWPTWNTLTGGSRLVRDGAANVATVSTDEDTRGNVEGVQRAVASGQVLAELILAAKREDEIPVVIEGHTRATAYVRELTSDVEIEAILGVSDRMAHWQLF